MPNIILELNAHKENIFEFTNEIVRYLRQKKCQVFSSDFEIAKNKNFLLDEEKITSADYILTFGGDGTLLYTARKYAKFDKPILGINFGHLGFLTGAEKKNVFLAIDNLLSKHYMIEKRSMLQLKNNVALNDICIGKSFEARLICFDLFVNNDFVGNYKADGLIISTPTGSTAYNLSAGGPIIKPTLPVFVLTPICPHTLYSRPIIISNDDEMKISIKSKLDNVKIIFDGQKNLPAEKDIIIKRSNFFAKIIKMESLSFFDVLREKFMK